MSSLVKVDTTDVIETNIKLFRAKHGFYPHPYQKTALEVFLDRWFTSTRFGLFMVAGGGKTLGVALMVDALADLFRAEHGREIKVAFISPLKTVTDQTTDDFPNCGVYQTGMKKSPTAGSVTTIYTYPTFDRMYNLKDEEKHKKKELPMTYDFIIVDEIQMLLGIGERLQKKIEKNNLKTKTMYMTATPFDGQRFALPLIERVKPLLPWKYTNSKIFIEEYQTLLPVVVKQMADNPLTKEEMKEGLNKDGTDFKKSIHEKAVEKGVDVVETIRLQLRGLQTIVLASGIEHANKLVEDFRKAGLTARAMHSDVKKSNTVLEAFKRGEFQIIVAIRMITVGTNIKVAINLVIACMIASIATLIQAIARTQRLGGGSEYALILDLFGNIKRLKYNPSEVIIPIPSENKKKKEKPTCEKCGGRYTNKCIDTWVEDYTVWRLNKKSCCGHEEVSGKEQEVIFCQGEEKGSGCNTLFAIEETYKEGLTIFTKCPNCSTSVVVEELTSREMEVVLHDRESFVTQVYAVYHGNLDTDQKKENFRKYLMIYALFSSMSTLQQSIKDVLVTNTVNKEEVARIIDVARDFKERFSGIFPMFHSKNFDLHSFSEIALLLVQNEDKVVDYMRRIVSKMKRWGYYNDVPNQEIDIKKLATKIKTHATITKTK